MNTGFSMNLFSRFVLLLAVIAFAGSLRGKETNGIVFDFESGDLGKEGWKILEGENSKPIGSRTRMYNTPQVPYQQHGKYYLTTLEQTGSDAPTDNTICVMESPVFVLEGTEAKFLLGGGKRPNTFVALCLLKENGDAEIVRKAVGKDNENFDEVTWDVSEFKNKPAFVQVVDKETGGWAHIRMDNFRTEGKLAPELTKLRENYYRNRQAIETLSKLQKEIEPVKNAVSFLSETYGSEKSYPEKLESIERELTALSKIDGKTDLSELNEKLAKIRDDFKNLKSETLSKNPLIVNQPILYVTRPQYLPDHHNTATLFQTGEINTGSFRGGGAMKIWDPMKNETKTILESLEGIIRDPCISFDAKTVLFSMRKNIGDDYHIYEMNLDGTGLRQITFSPGISDIDPLYLPDARILFSSSREPKYCMCNRHIMCNLFTMNPDGSNLEQIGHSTLFEGHASLLSDGRIIYDRWEYVDRNFGDAQGVWVTNPDGTNHAIFWGNNTASPGGVIDAHIIPGSDSVFLSTFTSCHDRPWGAIALVDRRRGIDGKQAVLQTWPPEAIDLVDRGNYDTFISLKQKFEDPFPLSEKFFLASGMIGKGEEMGIWILDTFGNMELIHTDAPGCYDPVPIIARTPPPAISSRIDLSDPNGYFYVSNVHEGHGMDKVKPGSAKYLRVIESPEKRFWTHTAWDNGTGTQAPAMSWVDFNNKRILGTAEIEEDGSVYFKVPANKFVYFQILDENGMMIQSMRSGLTARPGENNGCYGCHESRLETPAVIATTPLAMKKGPQKLKEWYGKPRLYSYLEEVQPVFDKYCTECHDYGKEAGEKLNLAGDRNLIFNKSYVDIYTKGFVKVAGAGPHYKLDPLSWGSNVSKLGEVVLNGHPDPKIDERRKELKLWFDRKSDPEAFDRVVTWIDINAPYYPTYASAYPDNPFGRSPIDNDKMNRLRQLSGVDPVRSWGISFDRPELSPILDRIPDKNSDAYRETLSIIESGRDALKKQDRGENEDFAPVTPVEIFQEKKYVNYKNFIERTNEAILKSEKVFEKEFTKQ